MSWEIQEWRPSWAVITSLSRREKSVGQHVNLSSPLSPIENNGGGDVRIGVFTSLVYFVIIIGGVKLLLKVLPIFSTSSIHVTSIRSLGRTAKDEGTGVILLLLRKPSFYVIFTGPFELSIRSAKLSNRHPLYYLLLFVATRLVVLVIIHQSIGQQGCVNEASSFAIRTRGGFRPRRRSTQHFSLITRVWSLWLDDAGQQVTM